MYIQISIVFLSRICINYNNCNILCYDLLRGSSLPFPRSKSLCYSRRFLGQRHIWVKNRFSFMILLFSVSRLSLFSTSSLYALLWTVDFVCVGGLQVPENCLIDMMEEQPIFCCPIIVITILLTNASIYLCFG